MPSGLALSVDCSLVKFYLCLADNTAKLFSNLFHFTVELGLVSPLLRLDGPLLRLDGDFVSLSCRFDGALDGFDGALEHFILFLLLR